MNLGRPMKRMLLSTALFASLGFAQTPPPPPPPPSATAPVAAPVPSATPTVASAPAATSSATLLSSAVVSSSLQASSQVLRSSSVVLSSSSVVSATSSAVLSSSSAAPLKKPAATAAAAVPVVNAPATSSATQASSQATSATVASSAQAKPAAATASNVAGVATATSSAAQSSSVAADSSKSKDSGVKTGYTGSVAVGIMNVNGQQVTRVSYRPEFSMGPFGVALDLELFIASDGHIQSTGWDFKTRDETLNSLARKIYYVRWNHPGDGFYARVGAIEGITLDAAGLITSGYGNVANYPGQKLVGTDVQFNDWFDPWNIDLEAVNNSVMDWNNGGGVVGLKASITPLGLLGLPIISKLRGGVTFVRDFNQFATLPDADKDHCPDAVDGIKGAGCLGTSQVVNVNAALNNSRGTLGSSFVDSVEMIIRGSDSVKVDSGRVVNHFAKSAEFTELGFDYQLPLITTDLLTWGVYGEYALPIFLGSDTLLNTAWGAVPLGTGVKFWKLDLGAEFRLVNGRFQVSNFDAAYEMMRVRLLDGSYQTKQQSVWDSTQDHGLSKGFFGRAGMDMWGIFQVNGTYSQLWAKDGSTDRGYTGKIALGKTVLGFIPKIAVVEAFYGKDHVRADHDSFFGPSIYTTYGYRVGLNLAGGMTVVVGNYTTYSRNTNNKLVPQSNFVAETVISF